MKREGEINKCRRPKEAWLISFSPPYAHLTSKKHVKAVAKQAASGEPAPNPNGSPHVDPANNHTVPQTTSFRFRKLAYYTYLTTELLVSLIPTLTETKSNEDLAAHGDAQPSEQAEYLQGIRLLTIVLSMMLAVFCVALDNTIIATAIPHMTDTFKTVDDIGWYGSAYLLTTCCKYLVCIAM